MEGNPKYPPLPYGISQKVEEPRGLMETYACVVDYLVLVSLVLVSLVYFIPSTSYTLHAIIVSKKSKIRL